MADFSKHKKPIVEVKVDVEIILGMHYHKLFPTSRTKEHQTVMRKTFTFLLLMVVILPGLGLTK